jgi:hypothetical protein
MATVLAAIELLNQFARLKKMTRKWRQQIFALTQFRRPL